MAVSVRMILTTSAGPLTVTVELVKVITAVSDVSAFLDSMVPTVRMKSMSVKVSFNSENI